MAPVTPFPDLDEVYAALAAGAAEVLGDTLTGVYVVGSFAVGDADEHSDADFLVVHDGPFDVDAAQALHARLHALPPEWARHLDGSWAPRDGLRRVDPARTPWWYLDNGQSQMVLDPHCNTAVTRWVLRERGIALAGPPPATLVDPVPYAALRDEIVASLDEWEPWPRESQTRFERGDGRPGMSEWKQPYVVLSYCRMLHTLETGEVHSKKASGEWALGALDPRWHGLVARALAGRPDPWGRVHRPAEPEAIDETLAFADYAAAEVRRRGSAATAPSSAATGPR